MSNERLMELSDVPEECSYCGSEVICAFRTVKNGHKHITALCTKIDCHPNYTIDGRRRYMPFKHSGGYNISQADLDFIQTQGSEFGIKFVEIGPTGDMPTCGYQGCESNVVEMHHIMPKGYADAADRWPVVALCPNHHDQWHAMLTAGLLLRASSYNWDSYKQMCEAMEEYGYTRYEEDHFHFWHMAVKDFEDAHDAAKFAAQNSEAAALRAQRALQVLEATPIDWTEGDDS